MAEVVTLLDPRNLQRNPQNPRLIFHQDELDALQESIAAQGILVPLAVFRDGKDYFILDGERRWRCASKLGLDSVPVIVQPKPDTMQNLMIMFAVHNARKDWDPLPTALKLRELEREFTKRNGRRPTETELAGISSLPRGVVRRLKKLLGLPEELQKELIAELEKPRSQQQITVDHVLEATKAAEALRKRGIIAPSAENRLRRAILTKFRSKVIRNTVDPRKLIRMSRAVQRGEIPLATARTVVDKIAKNPKYSIDAAYRQTVEQAEFAHSTEQLADRLTSRIEDHLSKKFRITDALRASLGRLASEIRKALRTR